MNQEILDYLKAFFKVDTIVFLDFETFYKTRANNGTKSFTLKNNTYYEYIFDERFQITGLSFTEDLGEFEYVHRPDDVAEYIAELKERRANGEKMALVAWNTQFDGSILGWRFKMFFDAYIDGMLMRAAMYSNRRLGLKYAARDEWPDDEEMQKGGEELEAVDGIRYEYITDEQHEALEKYAIRDGHLARELTFVYTMRLIERKLELELSLMHITLRGCIEPQFIITRELLFEVLDEEEDKKSLTVHEAVNFCAESAVKATKASFSSNPQYAELLKKMGMSVPLKVSPSTGMFTPALGKNDPEYIKAQIKHPDLQPLFAAREAVKSTISASRATRMINAADMFHENGFRNSPDMPFFLNYYGARQTGRWSGGQKLNQQNNTRGGKHRLSMQAPEKHLIAVCDLSNIELRVNMWFCGQEDILARFAADSDYDYYSHVATGIFNRPINKKTDPDERQMGKAAGLGLGFAMGWSGFQAYLASGPLGMPPMFKTDEFCRGVKNAYNQDHPMVQAMWNFLQNQVMPIIALGGELAFGPNNAYIARKDSLELPSGRILHYANARFKGQETRSGFTQKVVFDSDKYDRWGNPVEKYLWHGLLLENAVQATARDLLAWQMVKIEEYLQSNNFGWVMGSVHDETLNAVHEDHITLGYSGIQSIMSTGPEWARGIPLDCEGGYAKEYSK